MRCGSSCHWTCGRRERVISSVMKTIPTAAASAKPPVCFGPIRLNRPIAMIATIAHKPGESQPAAYLLPMADSRDAVEAIASIDLGRSAIGSA